MENPSGPIPLSEQEQWAIDRLFSSTTYDGERYTVGLIWLPGEPDFSPTNYPYA